MIAIDFRKLLSATVRRGKTGYFYWIGSDSWGAKIHPVRHQEWAAEGAITILPKRSSLEGERGSESSSIAIALRKGAVLNSDLLHFA